MKKDAVSETIRTYEKIAEEFNKHHSNLTEHKARIDFFIQNLKGKKILDIGCGTGRESKYFSEHGFDTTGIDLCSNLLKIATEKAPNAKFIQMDLRKLDFPKNSFDGIWAYASILHIPKKDAKRTLMGFNRVLKKGGLIFISLKQGKVERFVKYNEYPGKKRFFAFYSERELKNLVLSCGLKILKLVTYKRKSMWMALYATKQKKWKNEKDNT